MLSKIAIASLALGSAGFVCSRVQSQLVHAVAFAGSVVPQNGHALAQLSLPVEHRNVIYPAHPTSTPRHDTVHSGLAVIGF